MSSHIAGLYDMENTLGSGHFAVVKSARHVFTGLRVAIKVIDKLKLDEVSRTHLYQEVRCMKLVSHPSIIRLYEVIDTQTKLYLIQELGDGGDLYDYIMKHPNGVEEDVARCIFRETVSAIQYCHKLHVVHRDLKPENLVLCSGTDEAGNPTPSRVKLTDFGLSRTFLPGELIESSCGSLEYSAPEILLGDSYDPPKIDVWSLGVILFMLITGRSPFAYGGAGEILTRIMDAKYHCPPHVSQLCTSLIATMLVVDSQHRASLEQVANHSWVVQGREEEEEEEGVVMAMAAPLPSIDNIDDIPKDELDLILYRMEGNYGTVDSIMNLIKEKPYGSTAATFFLLAEAERYRKYSRTQHPSRPARINSSTFSPIAGNTLPAIPNGPHLPGLISPRRSHGSAESGILQRRYTSALTTPTNTNRGEDKLAPLRSSEELKSPYYSTPPRKYGTHAFTPVSSSLGSHAPITPYSTPQQPNTPPNHTYHGTSPLSNTFSTPRMGGVAGEQRSLILTPKPAFPLNVQEEVENEDQEVIHRQSLPAMNPPPSSLPLPPVTMENMDHTPFIFRARALSVFEEESETESVSESNMTGLAAQYQARQISSRQISSSPPHVSPHHHPSPPHLSSPHTRSRRLSNARSSPNLFGSISKSDVSDDEEDEEEDDIVELMTTSGRFPNKVSTFPRISPSNSPLLTSRRSPTHYLTGSSDDEVCNVFDSGRKHRSKRLPYRKRSLTKLGRVDSISSDDGNNPMETVRRPSKKERLLRLRQYNSLPATPADNSASESLTDLLDNLRRNRSGSCKTDSSLSDGGDNMADLAKSAASKFELSDEDYGQNMVVEPEDPAPPPPPPSLENGMVKRAQASTTLRSVLCSII